MLRIVTLQDFTSRFLTRKKEKLIIKPKERKNKKEKNVQSKALSQLLVPDETS